MESYGKSREEVGGERMEKVIVLLSVLCIVLGASYLAFSAKDPREKKCIDGTLYWANSSGYWQAYNTKCKAFKDMYDTVPVE